MIDFSDNKKVIYVSGDEQNYTGSDFLAICNGVEPIAQAIYDICDNQHPRTILDEIGRELESMEEVQIVNYCKAIDETVLMEIFNEYDYSVDENESTSRNIRIFSEYLASKRDATV